MYKVFFLCLLRSHKLTRIKKKNKSEHSTLVIYLSFSIICVIINKYGKFNYLLFLCIFIFFTVSTFFKSQPRTTPFVRLLIQQWITKQQKLKKITSQFICMLYLLFFNCSATYTTSWKFYFFGFISFLFCLLNQRDNYW